MAKRILIVDDDPGIVEVLSVRLTSNGYEVAAAHDGEAALVKIRAEKPDLVILDILMPGIDGITLCGIIKYDPQIKSIPVILVTVKHREIDKQVGRTVKADAYITKPFDIKDVIEKVRNLIGE
jgi:two-component system, OmpR family, alkaline phosphatase synthesis response regulator PhoP